MARTNTAVWLAPCRFSVREDYLESDDCADRRWSPFSLSGLISESQPEAVETDRSGYVPSISFAGMPIRPTPKGLRYRTNVMPASGKPATPVNGTPLARVYQKLLNLRRPHTDFIDAGKTKKAKMLSRRMAEVERRFRYPVSAPHSIHAIGIYNPRAQQAGVQVTDTSAPVVLVLTAFSAACCVLEAEDDVQVEFVICTGYHRQTIDGLPLAVLVFSSSDDDRVKDYAYGPDRKKWDMLTDFLRMTSFWRKRTDVTDGVNLVHCSCRQSRCGAVGSAFCRHCQSRR